jgi:hypothetical protein
MMKKRDFLLCACTAALAPGAWACRPSTAVPAAAWTQPAASLAGQMTLASWMAYREQPFVAEGEGRQAEVVLDRIESLPGSDRHTQFTLGFRTGAELPAGLYELRHANGQSVTLALNNPSAPVAGSYELRAEFSLLTA